VQEKVLADVAHFILLASSATWQSFLPSDGLGVGVEVGHDAVSRQGIHEAVFLVVLNKHQVGYLSDILDTPVSLAHLFFEHRQNRRNAHNCE
jgi:hypothetical protein